MKNYNVSYRGWVTFDVKVKANRLEDALVVAEEKMKRKGFGKSSPELMDFKFRIDGVFESDFKEPAL